MNIADILVRSAPHFERKPICIFKDEPTAYDQLSDRVRRLTAALRKRGAEKGSTVILLMQSCPEWLVSFFAIMATGATAVPINPGLAPPEVKKIANHCEAAIALVQTELAGHLEGIRSIQCFCVFDAEGHSEWHRLCSKTAPDSVIAEMTPEDPALIYYTSGTTGLPKGVVLSHRAVLFAAEMFSRHLAISPGDRALVTGSMAFILHLIVNGLTSLNHGATLVLLERFHPEMAVQAIEKHRTTFLMAVPTAYVMMLNWMGGKRCDLSSLRFAITAGASFPAALYERAKSVFGLPIFDLWGMTECAPITSYDPKCDTEGRLNSCGRPLPGCHVRIVDDSLNDLPAGETGEVLLKSPAIMTGYFKNEKATAETIFEGWVRSGDLGKLDDDGFLYIIGRKKDLIIRGGANIYPVDIEEVLYGHAAVGECAVIGVPDQTFGEQVKAFVVIRTGMGTTEAELADYCRQNIAEYKVPAQIKIVDSLPKGPTGKILRRQLREMSA